MTDGFAAHDDVARTLAVIRAQAAMVRTHAFELEQLGLTLSGRDLDCVDIADLVSYLVWISQFTSHTARVLASWGVGLVAYVDATTNDTSALQAAGSSSVREDRSTAGRTRRWWRRARHGDEST